MAGGAQQGSVSLRSRTSALSPQQLSGLLAWPVAALRCGIVLAGQGGLPVDDCLAAATGAACYLELLADEHGASAAHLAALEATEAALPAVLQGLAILSSHLPLPGQDAFSAVDWTVILVVSGRLLPIQGVEAATAGALVAPAQGSRPSIAAVAVHSSGTELLAGMVAMMKRLQQQEPCSQLLW
ncbi:hypothetical protein ABPG75_011927 [Micractinium tetrahymenae]